MPKNLGLYNDNLSVPRKQDVDAVQTELETKLTTPIGTQGQYLGFTENNVVGAVDAPSGGPDIQIAIEQPTNQTTGDFWYQIV